jgi:hypothetical protein
MAVYSAGFLMFWALTALSAALTLFMQKTAEEVNHPPATRPGTGRHSHST